MNTVIDSIRRDVKQLLNHPTYQQWAAARSPHDGDVCLINNSFVYRDVSTTKSEQYIAIRYGNDGEPESTPYIVTGIRLNSDFKYIAAQSSNFPALITLQEAVQVEIAQLGSLAFLLIGYVEDTVAIEQPLSHSAFDRIVWDPTLPDIAQVNHPVITVQDTYDEDAIWLEITTWFTKRGESIPDGLRESVGVALDKLQDKAVAKLSIPTTTKTKQPSMTDNIVEVLKEQRGEYAKALSRLAKQRPGTQPALNDILRIAYNFAGDASMFLRLIVSVCDLKPIILWGTIAEHFKLSESFKCLPWTRSLNKPSLKNYISTISDARNSAFHNLFPFRKSLNAILPEAAFQHASLRIFSEHGKKKENQLHYQDRELVEVLFEFTRARERRAPIRFWQQNLDVMDSAIELFDQCSKFLKTVFAVT